MVWSRSRTSPDVIPGRWDRSGHRVGQRLLVSLGHQALFKRIGRTHGGTDASASGSQQGIFATHGEVSTP